MRSSGPTVRRRRLGLILRDLRARAGLTCEEVGRRIERSDSWVSRIETGRSALRTRDLNGLLDLYGLDDQGVRGELEILTRQGRQRGWWNRYGESVSGPYATYIGFEAEARRMETYDALVVPGLLQTEEYARALLRCGVPPEIGEAAERKIRIRLTRQGRLVGADPIQLYTIIDESVLRRSIGGIEVMRAQCRRLLEVAIGLPQVVLRVVPLGRAINPGMTASFGIMEFAPPDDAIVFSEGPTGQILTEEPDAERFRRVFGELRSVALDEADSIEMVRGFSAEAV
jgi:transcriptional regulator with XRE-family HTH domain